MNDILELTKNIHAFTLDNVKSKCLPYTVGALLYSPATNIKLSTMLLEKKIQEPYSLALCLEDSIHDNAVELAEDQIISLFQSLYEQVCNNLIEASDIPKIFIRVRRPKQVNDLFLRLEKYQSLLTGFIFPKYSLNCSTQYNDAIVAINKYSDHRIYMMPIIESDDIIDFSSRYTTLSKIKSQVDNLSDYVLNIRVGGNDFCKGYGIRRHYDEMIYDIHAVSNILGDIITTFSKDYVLSGPVWEYFSSENEEWKLGLMKELKYDRLNGFIGKTVIHPNQIPVVNESLKVRQSDLMDAISILNYKNDITQVVKSSQGERMNEIKTHTKWAEKIVTLAYIYGVKG